MAEAPIGLSGDPTQLIRELMGRLMQPMQQPDFSGLERLLNSAQQSQQQLGGQLQQAQQAPEPQLDPLAQFIERAVAGTGEALTGTELTQGVEERGKNELTQRREKRAQNLALLIRQHEAAVERANKIGDAAEEIKLRTKIESLHKQYDNMKAALGAGETLERSKQSGLDRGAQAERDRLNRESEERRAGLSAAAQERVANIYSAGKDTLIGLPPGTRLRADNLAKRIVELEEQAADLATRTDKRGRLIIGRNDKARQEVEAVRTRAATLEAQLQRLLTPAAQDSAGGATPAGASSVTPEEAAAAAVKAGITNEAQLVKDYASASWMQGVPLPEIRAAFRRLLRERNSQMPPSYGGTLPPPR